MRFDTAFSSDLGKLRETNEDSCLALDVSEPKALASSYGIYLVADGMGGHQAGEVASKMAAETISSTILDSLSRAKKLPPPSHLVKQALKKANTQIYKMAGTSPQLSAMGTTLTLGLRVANMLYLGHIGDSRAYLIRRGRIRQLTEDHSVVASLLKAGMITPEEAKTHAERGKIFRCLGVSTEVDIDVSNRLLQSGDSLVFCTDGLTNHVSDSEILDSVEKESNADSACQKLIHLANLRGGEDNISLIVVKIKPWPGHSRVRSLV